MYVFRRPHFYARVPVWYPIYHFLIEATTLLANEQHNETTYTSRAYYMPSMSAPQPAYTGSWASDCIGTGVRNLMTVNMDWTFKTIGVDVFFDPVTGTTSIEVTHSNVTPGSEALYVPVIGKGWVRIGAQA